jgi:hypothetical protein
MTKLIKLIRLISLKQEKNNDVWSFLNDFPNFECLLLDFDKILFGNFDESMWATFDLSVSLNVFENVTEDFQKLFFFNKSTVWT